MINRLRARLNRPEAGWDPVPALQAETYSREEWQGGVNEAVLDQLEKWIGGFAGKDVLDLGGGPGQYSVAFAQRGAHVTWHDVSRRYLSIARQKAVELGVAERITFSLGYMDEAPRILGRQYDLVFNRICWYYGFSDRSFADVIYALVRPHGYAYVDAPHSEGKRDGLSKRGHLREWLNATFGIKLRAAYPPHGRIERLFSRYPAGNVRAQERPPGNDLIWFQKGP